MLISDSLEALWRAKVESDQVPGGRHAPPLTQTPLAKTRKLISSRLFRKSLSNR